MVKSIELNDIKGLEIIGGQITSRIECKDGDDLISTVKVLVPKSIEKGIVNHENLGTLNVKCELDEKKTTQLGDVVIKLSTPYDAALITDEDTGFLVPSFCVILRVDGETVDKDYLVAFLNSKYCLSQIKDLVSGATMPMLSTGTLKKIRVLLPDMEVQKQMANDYAKALKKEKLLRRIIDLEYERFDSEIYELMED